MARKGPRKKQSFFKVLLGDFSKHLRIPHAFLKNLSGLSLGKCALKGPSGKRWIVELEERENGLFFYAAGWQDFVKDHLLQVGDFLVFYYYGESKFKVKIYDKSACEKDVEEADRKNSNPVSLENYKGNQARVKEEIVESEAENYDTDSENKATIANRRSGNAMSGKRPTTGYVIPKKLAISEGLVSMGTVMLRNESGRSWCAKVILRPKSSFHRMELTTGWAEFCKANQISVGDTVIFEFVKQSLIQIHVFRAVRGKRCAVVLDTLNVKNES
ncbi:hypothetical protein C1H46_009403 [Malus baccata]|uniref:TF-B3 domain-containing protein n=1 Tax=Malus baccata TaxID=106549 RepID=A0A540N1K3_MALBA|nr:hypothetical protein C1H46_009403 [Malus baccata]